MQVEARKAGPPPDGGHVAPPARQSTRTFITRPPWASLSNAAGACASASVRRDQCIHRDRALRQELDGGREVGAVVDARAEDLQLLPEDPLHVDLPRLRVDADRHEPAAGAERGHREIEARLGAGHLERRRPRRRRPTTCRARPAGPLRRSRVRRGPAPPRPSAGTGRARPGAPSRPVRGQRPRSARRWGRRRRPGRALPATARLARRRGGPPRPARRVPRRAAAGRVAAAPGAPAARSRAAASPRSSRCRRSPGGRRCGHARPGRWGTRPHQRSGITVTGSPADQPVTPSPTTATRPDISCPITPWSATRSSMWPARMCRSVPQIPT